MNGECGADCAKKAKRKKCRNRKMIFKLTTHKLASHNGNLCYYTGVLLDCRVQLDRQFSSHVTVGSWKKFIYFTESE